VKDVIVEDVPFANYEKYTNRDERSELNLEKWRALGGDVNHIIRVRE